MYATKVVKLEFWAIAIITLRYQKS